MLPKVETSAKKLENYQHLITKKQFKEIKSLAEDMKGLKVNLVNSTPKGGGVAEILRSLVPLMKGVGLKAEWYTIPGSEEFFKITKEMHNALQGKNYDFPFSHRKRYLKQMEKSAKLIQDMKADVWVIHDPQPAGVIQFLSNFHPSICHIHIDISSPNRNVWDFISGYLEMYDSIIVSSKDFVKTEIEREAIVCPPAIDPLMIKNKALGINASKNILKRLGIDPERPLISQVSRFDPWKDPLGVVKAYKMAKKEIPGLQLALVGLILAQDDPEAIRVFNVVKEASKNDPDIFLFADPKLLGSLKVDTFVNALQVSSKAILQNSIKEGFGMTVAEAMWKGKAVIGGNASGIRTQIKDGENGFFTSTPRETSKRIVKLVRNPVLSSKIGRKAHQATKENFLMPRLLRDYLELFKKITTKTKTEASAKATADVMSVLASY